MADKFRILSLDGGGLRGIIPVLILKEIERRTGQRILDLFDMVAGTSTGGLIACGIAVSDNGKTSKYSLQDIEDIYIKRGKEIFPQKNLFKKIIGSITSLKHPKFSADGLQKVLVELLDQKRISDCAKPIFITSYDLLHNEALLFKYRHAINFPENNALLVDVCRATTAAPTYLPAYDFMYENKKRICVDGGLYMNNPGMGALVEVIKFHEEQPYNLPDLKLNEVAILSLGTGHYSSDISRQKAEEWGLLDWAANVTDVMMQAVNQTTTYETQELTSSENFLRINPEISNYSDIADSSEEARNYFIDVVNKDVIGNTDLMNKLDTFLNDTRPVSIKF